MFSNSDGAPSLRHNVHTIHPKFYVLLVISILFRADRVDSMHIGAQGGCSGYILYRPGFTDRAWVKPGLGNSLIRT